MSEKRLSFNPGHTTFLEEMAPDLYSEIVNGELNYDSALRMLKNSDNPQLVDQFFHAISQELNQVDVLDNLDLVQTLLDLGKTERAIKVFSATRKIFERKVQEIPLYEQALKELVGTTEHTEELQKRLKNFASKIEEGTRRIQEIESRLANTSV